MMSENLKESLRFEIIKRLAPGYRHKALMNVQPISLMSQPLSKKIQPNQNDSEYIVKRLREIKSSLKTLSLAIENLFFWLNPSEDIDLPVSEVVSECLDLLKMEIYKSNVSFTNNVTSTELVNAATVRNLFSACILTYIDTVNSSSEVIVSTRLHSKDITIEMTINRLLGKADKALNSHSTFTDWSAIISLNETSNLIRINENVLITKIT